MIPAMILYFSGTGNSRAVAEELGRISGEEVSAMTPHMRGGSLILPEGDGRLIWVFPIYSWGVPPYVLDIIRSVEIAGGERLLHHAVVTCGDDCGLADRMWRKAIGSRGWHDGCVMSVQMPNNYVCLPGFDVDPKELESKKLAAFPARVRQVAGTIARAESEGRQVTDIVRGGMAWIKTKVIYPWFVRNAMSPSRFGVSDACIACRQCERTCPLGNITMQPAGNNPKAVHPSWGKDCAGCLGCYHICPVHAISYTRATRNKGQYHKK